MSHGCGGCCNGDHTHMDDSPEMGVEYSLYTKIDKENLTCLNEREDGSGKDIFKPWEERLNMNKVRSRLILNFPLTYTLQLYVKLAKGFTSCI